MRIEIKQGIIKCKMICQYGCAFFDLSRGLDGDSCKIEAGLEADHHNLAPGPSCPGPGLYELIRIDPASGRPVLSPEQVDLLGIRLPPPEDEEQKGGVAAFFGKFPGDETAQELLEQLGDLDGAGEESERPRNDAEMETTIEKLESDMEIEKELAKQLRAENGRLRGICEGLILISDADPDMSWDNIVLDLERLTDKARAALEGKA